MLRKAMQKKRSKDSLDNKWMQILRSSKFKSKNQLEI